MKWKFIFIVLVIAVIQNAMAQDSVKVFKNRISLMGGYEYVKDYTFGIGYQRSLHMTPKSKLDLFGGVGFNGVEKVNFAMFRTNFRYCMKPLDLAFGVGYRTLRINQLTSNRNVDVYLYVGINRDFANDKLSIGANLGVGQSYIHAKNFAYEDVIVKELLYVGTIEFGINF